MLYQRKPLKLAPCASYFSFCIFILSVLFLSLIDGCIPLTCVIH
uniref:Uncharacterized protein n=1 Tax=Rhizophora mucronata TaxID=61149 RepID=A0A2P2Q057_RHIMU